VKRVLLLPAKAGETHTIMEGSRIELIPEIYPFNAHNKNLIATSDNPGIASAVYDRSAGRVYAKDATTEFDQYYIDTWIRVTAEDGGGASASHRVYVEPQPC
jgi:uncharacterized protein YjdB